MLSPQWLLHSDSYAKFVRFSHVFAQLCKMLRHSPRDLYFGFVVNSFMIA